MGELLGLLGTVHEVDSDGKRAVVAVRTERAEERVSLTGTEGNRRVNRVLGSLAAHWVMLIGRRGSGGIRFSKRRQ
jgi:hypothetical protein